MQITLAENIRRNRKERKMTQEQLAEVLGVTSGAVYKWESGLSIPELEVIIAMAEFFDSSVDALLGYRMDDSRFEAVVSRLNRMLRTRDPAAAAEAEMLVRKHPNSFDALMIAASVYYALGGGSHDEYQLRRSLDLLEKSLTLISQNTDPTVSEQTIYGNIAEIYIMLGESEKGVELLKQHNGGGEFSAYIGLELVTELGRYEEAEPYLTQSMLKNLSSLGDTVFGYALTFLRRGDHSSAIEILKWLEGILDGIENGDVLDFMEKIHSYLLVMLAVAQKAGGDMQTARVTMGAAAKKAFRFDSDPDYGVKGMRFISAQDDVLFMDMLGETAVNGVEKLLSYIGDEEINEMWNEAKANG